MLSSLAHWLLMIGLLVAQQLAEAAVVIPLHGSRGEHQISTQVEVLEDASAVLKFDAVSDPNASLDWKTYPTDVPKFGFTDKVYWVRMQLQNTGESNEPWYLELSYPNHDYLEFYQEDANGSFIGKESGDRRPFSQRDMRYHNFIFKLDIPAGATRRFYLRSQSESSMQFPLQVWTPTALAEKINRELLCLGIYYGIMLAIVLYNIFIFFWLRYLNYLTYVLYISCFAIYQAAINGLILEYILPEQPDLANQCVPVISSLATLFAMIFSTNFLQTSKHCPRFHRVLLFFIGMAFCFVGLAFFASYSISIRFGSAMILIAIPCMIFASVLCLRSGYRPARYFFAAWTALLGGVFLYHLHTVGLLPSSFLTVYGNQIGSSIEVILLSLALADKIKIEQMLNQRKIETLNTELEAHLRNVEHQVEDKTRDIKSILENIRQGIFMIMPQGFRIHKDHSAHLKEILQRDDIDQSNAVDLLFRHSTLSPDAVNQVKSVLEASLEQDEINFVSNSHCLPQELLYRSPFAHSDKVLRLDWSPIIGAEHRIDKILVAVRDETDVKNLEAQAQKQQQELDYMSQIIDIPQDKFVRFLEASYTYLDQNQMLIQKHATTDSEALRLIFINLHTLKGMSRNYGLKQLTDSLHEAELLIKSLQNIGTSCNQEQLLKAHVLIRERLDHYVRVNVEKLGRKNALQTVELPLAAVEDMIQACEALLAAQRKESPLRQMYATLVEKIYTDAADVLERSCSRAQRLARDLSKEDPQFKIQASGYAFNRRGEQLIEAILTHLIRNSLDHGIETKDERIQRGKSPAGSILMNIDECDGQLRLIYQDDGRGLCLSAIQEKAVTLALISKESKLSQAQIAELIFQPGLSTSSRVSDISGHGVGMDAVRSYLEQAGGSIFIQLFESKDFKGTAPFAFHIILPTQLYVAISLKQAA